MENLSHGRRQATASTLKVSTAAQNSYRLVTSPPITRSDCPSPRIEGLRSYDVPSELAGFAFPGNGVHAGPIAPVERGPSEGARSGSTGPAWMSFPVRISANKKDGLATPYFLSIFANSAK